jgi:hypothetical protein
MATRSRLRRKRPARFRPKHDAFDAAAELARKLRFVGASLDVRVDQIDEPAKHAKAS